MMSPVTATLKCTRGTGVDTHGAEAATEVACDEYGRGRQAHPKEGLPVSLVYDNIDKATGKIDYRPGYFCVGPDFV